MISFYSSPVPCADAYSRYRRRVYAFATPTRTGTPRGNQRAYSRSRAYKSELPRSVSDATRAGTISDCPEARQFESGDKWITDNGAARFAAKTESWERVNRFSELGAHKYELGARCAPRQGLVCTSNRAKLRIALDVLSRAGQRRQGDDRWELVRRCAVSDNGKVFSNFLSSRPFPQIRTDAKQKPEISNSDSFREPALGELRMRRVFKVSVRRESANASERQNVLTMKTAGAKNTRQSATR